MTKNHLIDHVSESLASTKKDAEAAVDAILASISNALAKGEKVELRGFGTFQVASKKERLGRNPRTGETMKISARSVPVFKPSKELADRVNTSVEAALEDSTDADSVAVPSEGSAKLHGDKINT